MRLLILSAALFLAGPALAADNPTAADAATAPSEETVAAALALFETADFEELVRSSVMHMTQAGIDGEMELLKAKGVEMPEDLLTRLRELVFTEAGELVADMMPTLQLDAAMIYTRYFSLEELKELRLLQEHPVMRKAEKVAPQMMADLSKIGMEAAIARQPAMEEKIEALIEEWLAKEGVADKGPTT